MGIKKDAGEILLFIYDCYVNDKDSVNPEKLLETTKWEGNRIGRAVKYLKEIGAIDITLLLGENKGIQNFIFEKIPPKGIHMIETKPEFKRNFGFEVNLGLLKFSWGASEK